MPSEAIPVRASVQSDLLLRLSANTELARVVEDLSRILGTSSAQTIAQSLAMFDFVVKAGQEGKRLALVDDEFHVDQEIVIPGRRDGQG